MPLLTWCCEVDGMLKSPTPCYICDVDPLLKFPKPPNNPGGFPLFSGKVQIVSRTLSRLFLVGALNRPRKRKRTNRENPRTIPEQIGKIPEKSGKSQKVTLPALQKNVVNMFFARLPGILHCKMAGILVNFFWSPFAMKQSTKNPRKIQGRFGAEFGAKSGTKIRRNRRTFVLQQLSWPEKSDSEWSAPKWLKNDSIRTVCNGAGPI